jgi:hypothetical protein
MPLICDYFVGLWTNIGALICWNLPKNLKQSFILFHQALLPGMDCADKRPKEVGEEIGTSFYNLFLE